MRTPFTLFSFAAVSAIVLSATAATAIPASAAAPSAFRGASIPFIQINEWPAGRIYCASDLVKNNPCKQWKAGGPDSAFTGVPIGDG